MLKVSAMMQRNKFRHVKEDRDDHDLNYHRYCDYTGSGFRTSLQYHGCIDRSAFVDGEASGSAGTLDRRYRLLLYDHIDPRGIASV